MDVMNAQQHKTYTPGGPAFPLGPAGPSGPCGPATPVRLVGVAHTMVMLRNVDSIVNSDAILVDSGLYRQQAGSA